MPTANSPDGLPGRSGGDPGPRRARRDRRGRGQRGPDVLPGPLAPAGVPASRTRHERFDLLALSVFDDIESRWETRMPPVDLAVEEVPILPAGWAGDRVPLASLAPGTPTARTRIVLFRRPIERRVAEPEDLPAVLLAVLVDQVADLLGIPPGDVHPDYRPDDE